MPFWVAFRCSARLPRAWAASIVALALFRSIVQVLPAAVPRALDSKSSQKNWSPVQPLGAGLGAGLGDGLGEGAGEGAGEGVGAGLGAGVGAGVGDGVGAGAGAGDPPTGGGADESPPPPPQATSAVIKLSRVRRRSEGSRLLEVMWLLVNEP